jgi:cell division protein FtsB
MEFGDDERLSKPEFISVRPAPIPMDEWGDHASFSPDDPAFILQGGDSLNRQYDFFGVVIHVSIAVIVIALLAVGAYFFQKPFSDYLRLSAEHRDLIERNKELVHERNEWDRYIQRLRTDERELIREARRLGYAREGEYLYYFPAE